VNLTAFILFIPSPRLRQKYVRPCAQAGDKVQRRNAGSGMRRPTGEGENLRFGSSLAVFLTGFDG
jgi:hypothetical protein